MKKNLLAGIFFVFIGFLACQNHETTSANHETESEESCVNPQKDPNEVKPMARMMRTMADYCDTMRLELRNGKTVDSVRFPLMPFWTAEPTDSSVLETLFFNNAKSFAAAWRTLMTSEKNQKANYELVIAQCVNCHSSYCSGPLKRIRKLPLEADR